MALKPVDKARELRKTLVKNGNILAVDFSATMQGNDTSRVINLMPLVGTDYYPFRAKVNVKGIDPIASEEYNTDFVDIRKMSTDEIENFIKRQEFDFMLWYKHDDTFDMHKIADMNYPFIVQLGGCNYHDGSLTGGCTYCFVDNESNDGTPKGKVYISPEQYIESMLAARENIHDMYLDHGFDINPRVIRLSGGEPTIGLDFYLNVWRIIQEKGLDLYGQIDSNLSTGMLVDAFEKEGVFEPHTLEQLAEISQGRAKVLAAVKGVNDKDIQRNVKALQTLDGQTYTLLRFVDTMDPFIPLYNCDPEGLPQFLDDMESMVENISLRMHIGALFGGYGPTKDRVYNRAQIRGNNPEESLAKQQQEWDDRRTRNIEIMENYLQHNYGVAYKDTVRSDVELVLKPKGRAFIESMRLH